VLFGVVLGVRLLFLVGEHKLLLHIITYYQDVVKTPITHSTQKVSSSTLPKDLLSLSKKSSIDFRREVREILGGDTSGTIHVLIVSVLIQVIYWFSDFKIVIEYDPSTISNNL
jgi:hypothetical protein